MADLRIENRLEYNHILLNLQMYFTQFIYVTMINSKNHEGMHKVIYSIELVWALVQVVMFSLISRTQNRQVDVISRNIEFLRSIGFDIPELVKTQDLVAIDTIDIKTTIGIVKPLILLHFKYIEANGIHFDDELKRHLLDFLYPGIHDYPEAHQDKLE